VADTENNVPKSNFYSAIPDVEVEDSEVHRPLEVSELDLVEEQSSTRVWLTAICPVSKEPDYFDVDFDLTVEGFLSRVRNKPSGSIVFFHNLAYDGPLIVVALLRMGYTLDADTSFRKPKAGTFRAMVSDTGAWYQVSVTFQHGNRNIIFRDSLKIIPFSVDDVGEALQTKHRKLTGTIDYQKQRPVGYEPTPKEYEYAANDVLVMAEAIYHLTQAEVDLTRSITIGSACMREFKRTIGKKAYDGLFIPLPRQVDRSLRESYRGGWCYVNRDNHLISRNQCVDLTHSAEKGQTYDVNSLYPFAMYQKRFPVGPPRRVSSSDLWNTDEEFIVRLRADFYVKPGHLPFIQLKGSFMFAENEYVKDTNGPEEITLTRPDWELFQEQYECRTLEVLDLWVFSAVVGPFDEYIEYWYEKKATADNPVDRLIAKLMLNNLYGKLAQSWERASGVPEFDEEGVLRLRSVEQVSESGGYIPAGAYITAYARGVTVRAAQANYDRFLYSDTDSIHMVGAAVGITVDPDALGAWDHEATWDLARFVRQKTYVQRISAGKKKGQMLIKAAGAPAAVKDRLRHAVTFWDADTEEWVYERLESEERDGKIVITSPKRSDREVVERMGIGVTEAGKLRRRAVTGGVVLEETTWRISGDEPTDPSTGIVSPEWSVV